MPVVVERNADNIIITIPSTVDPIDVQRALDYFKFIDIVNRSQATEEDIENLSDSIKAEVSKNILAKLMELDEFKDLKK